MAAEDSREWREVGSSHPNPEGGRVAEVRSDNSRTEAAITHSVSRTPDRRVRHDADMTRPAERRAERAFAPAQGDMDSVGLLFVECIEGVSRLEAEREGLIEELQRLRQPMMRAAAALRAECEEARRLFALVQLDCVALREEVRQVKTRLFVTARDCIQSQVALAEQQYEVAQDTVTQEELQSRIQSLTQELAELPEAQQNRLNTLRERARKPRAASDATHCRRASLSLQRRLSGSVRSLEGWYEPRLLALLRRRQSAEEVLRRTREAGQDLRVQLGPLGEERQGLELQRACLEKRIVLVEDEREERAAQYKETVEALEETIGELKLELQVQRKSKTSLEELKNDLLRELECHRRCHGVCRKNIEEGDR